jgi:hypothetical protein
MNSHPLYPVESLVEPSSTEVPLSPFDVLLGDQNTIHIRGRQNDSFKYLLHLILLKPEVTECPVGHQGWIPMGYRTVGIIALRLDYSGRVILGQPISALRHREWIALCSRLGVFSNGLDQLELSPELRRLAEWDSEPQAYFFRNIWLKGHWQWLRIQEENPGLTTLTLSLAEIVAAAEARALAAVPTALVGGSAVSVAQQGGPD